MLGSRGAHVVAGDVEPDGLAAPGEHLFVEHPVALVRGDGVLDEVPVAQGGQDADHSQLRAVVARLRPDRRQLVEQLLFEVAPLVAGQWLRREVELEVPPAQLGLELRRAERLQHVLADRCGLQVVADQVQLDLEAGHRLVPGEGVLAEHHLEGVDAAQDVRAIALSVVSTERCPVDFLTHARAVPSPLTAPGGPLRLHTTPPAATAGRMTLSRRPT